jgi:23S rRNA (uracil1939-C5)-methyltransferase
MAILDLRVERAVAGGRMLARHDGLVVLVSGAVPGERVRAEVERSAKSVAWARVVEVVEASPSRRPTAFDPACGGMDYAHVAYAGQLALKRDVIVDAFQRIGRIDLESLSAVEGSPEHGYRLRARLHVRDGQAGYFREGTHVLCDAGATSQLHPDSLPATARVLAAIGPRVAEVAAAVVSENVAGTERVVHLEPVAGARLDGLALAPGVVGSDLLGVTAARRDRTIRLAGATSVTDTAFDLFGAGAPVPAETRWARHAASFFQANRFLVGRLVRAVLDGAEGRRIADFYAGVGLFAVALAAAGRKVVAVEGDRTAALDLAANAEPFGARLQATRAPVEDAARSLAGTRFDTIVLDPPRTGVSAAALDAVVRLNAPRLLYVSCDPATLARDSARLTARGYGVKSARAFDLFPNTAHVETVLVFERGGGG